MAVLENIVATISVNTKNLEVGFGRALNTISKSTANIDQKLDKIANKFKSVGKGLTLGLTLPLAALGGASLKAASDAEETASKFATVFKDVSKEANTAAEALRKGYGLARDESKQLLSDTGDLLSGFGFSGEAALDLSLKVQKLAVDLASFTNYAGGSKGASEALTKALLGERESVKQLGIAILEEDVKAKVQALEVSGRFTNQTMREKKAIATLEIAYSQSKNAIGDYARTKDGLANRARLLRARLRDLSIMMGERLIPVAQRLIDVTLPLIDRFERLDPKIKTFTIVATAAAAALGPLIAGVGFMVSGLVALKAAIVAVGIPLMAIVGTFIYISSVTRAVIEDVTVLGDIFSLSFNVIRLVITSAIRFILSKFKSMIEGLEEITAGFDGLLTPLLGFNIAKRLGLVTKAIDVLDKDMEKSASNIKTNFTDAFDKIKDGAKKNLKDVQTIISDVKLPTFADMTSLISGNGDPGASSQKSSGETEEEKRKIMMEKMRADVKEITSLWFGFKANFEGIIADMRTLTSNLFQDIKSGFADAVSQSIIYGKDLVSNLQDLVKQIGASLIKMVIEVATERVLQAVVTATKITAIESAMGASRVSINAGVAGSAAAANTASINPYAAVAIGLLVAAAVSAAFMGMTQFAKGGVANQPSIFGEAGPEAALPLVRTANGDMGVRAIVPKGFTQNSTATKEMSIGRVNVSVSFPNINQANESQLRRALRFTGVELAKGIEETRRRQGLRGTRSI